VRIALLCLRIVRCAARGRDNDWQTATLFTKLQAAVICDLKK